MRVLEAFRPQHGHSDPDANSGEGGGHSEVRTRYRTSHTHGDELCSKEICFIAIITFSTLFVSQKEGLCYCLNNILCSVCIIECLYSLQCMCYRMFALTVIATLSTVFVLENVCCIAITPFSTVFVLQNGCLIAVKTFSAMCLRYIMFVLLS